jgi:hypothetical protein
MLKDIFSFVALTAVHTGIATGIAHAHGGYSSPVGTGFTSFGCALLGITFGAFAGDHIHDRHSPSNQKTGAAIYGLTGYAVGAVAGYWIR